MTTPYPNATEALKHIGELVADGQRALSDPLELPEPNLRLDVESRRGDELRLFKHLHQSCLLHTEIFRRANQIKLVHLLDGYHAMVDRKNPTGIYAMARSALEFAAFLSDVVRRLTAATGKGGASFEERGTGFFKVIVRARFGTSDPEKLQVLLKAGIPPEDAKPFHVLTCIENLVKDPAAAWVRPHYDFLCDYVHHNLSSQTVASTTLSIGGVSTSGTGGMLISRQPGPKIVYSYPAESQARYAIEQTAGRTAALADVALQTLNRFPSTPYSAAELVQRTGHPLGLTQLTRPPAADDPCFCGSGMKFGRCHGKPRKE